MRLAVQLSGQQRYGDYIKDFLKSLNAFDHVDVFAHHWCEPRTQDELGILLKAVSAPYPHITIRRVVVEPQIQFQISSVWKTHGHSVFSVLSMTYGIWRANQLRKEYEVETGATYDLVMRSRSDIRLNDFPQSADFFAPITDGCLYVGKRPRNILGGARTTVQDQIAIGTPKTMDVYTNLFHNFGSFFDEGNILGPEILFFWWLKTKNNFTINETGFLPEVDCRGFRSIDFRDRRQKY